MLVLDSVMKVKKGYISPPFKKVWVWVGSGGGGGDNNTIQNSITQFIIVFNSLVSGDKVLSFSGRV